MDKVSTINQDTQEKNNFSLGKTLFGKKAKIDFDVPDLSSAGGLVLFQVQDTNFLDKIAQHTFNRGYREKERPTATGRYTGIALNAGSVSRP